MVHLPVPAPALLAPFAFLGHDHPRTAVSYTPAYNAGHNRLVPEYPGVSITSAPIAMNLPPPAPVRWDPPYRLTPKPGPPPSSPSDLFKDPRTFERIDCWWRTSLELLGTAHTKLAAGEPYRFPYDDLEGGKDGLYIPETAFKKRFRGCVWDIAAWYREGQSGPLRPYSAEPLSARCAWDTRAMLDTAKAMGFSDTAILEELHETGIDNRSAAPGHVLLVPNYQNFFEQENFLFAQSKMSEQHAREPRPTTDFFAFVPTLPIIVTPRNVAIRPGTTKRRVTCDYGAPRGLDEHGEPGYSPPRAKDPGPLSVNGMESLSCTRAFPHIDYMSTSDMAHNIAILRDIGHLCAGPCPPQLLVSALKADYTAYYEQIPRPCSTDWMQGQLVSPKGGQLSKTCVFGDSGCCDQSNRLENYFCADARRRLRSSQAAFIRDELPSLPPSVRGPLEAWLSLRTEVASELRGAAAGIHCTIHHLNTAEYSREALLDMAECATDFFCVCGFFDDTAAYSFSFFEPHMRAAMEEQWTDFNIGVNPSKVEFCPAGTDMTFLGLLTRCGHGPDDGVVDLEPSKVKRYRAFAEELLGEVRAHKKRKVPLDDVQRLEGQLSYCASAKPTLRADMQVLRSVSGTAHMARPTCKHHAMPMVVISVDAEQRIRGLCDRLDSPLAAALMPRAGRVGLKATRIWIFTDASCDVSHTSAEERDLDLFRGWGAVIFIEGFGHLLVMQQPISWNARSTLQDSTAMELLAANAALTFAAPLVHAFSADVIHVMDNSASVGMCNTGRAHSPVERILLAQRSSLLDTLPRSSLVVGTHVVRDRIPEEDWLTKFRLPADPSDPQAAGFYAPLVARFGEAATHVAIVPAPDTRGLLVPALRAADQLRTSASRAGARRQHQQGVT